METCLPDATPAPADLLTPKECAALPKIEPQTLSKWRMAGRGPVFFRLSTKALRYRRTDVEAFLEQSSSSGQ